MGFANGCGDRRYDLGRDASKRAAVEGRVESNELEWESWLRHNRRPRLRLGVKTSRSLPQRSGTGLAPSRVALRSILHIFSA